MVSVRYGVSIVALIASATFALSCQRYFRDRSTSRGDALTQHAARGDSRPAHRISPGKAFSIPLSFEPSANSKNSAVQFIGRGKGFDIALTRSGIEFAVQQGQKRPARIASLQFAQVGLRWRGAERTRGESNYFIGKNPATWRAHVPHFRRAETTPGPIEVAAYGNENDLEYDMDLSPGGDVSKIHLQLLGATKVQLNPNGDLAMHVGSSEILMRKPFIYEVREAKSENAARNKGSREMVEGGYVIHPDGTIGFRVEHRDPRATLVIDPSISLAYSTFLGGSGTDIATSVAADSTGKIYVAGTTNSATTFAESTTAQLGPGSASGSGDPAEFFIAKIDPTQSGANSLVYLTFLGGSATQSGGLIAVDSRGDVAITGTTTSTDFPVTDQSKPTSGLTNGGNDTTVSEIDPTGSKLLYSTLFGGNGWQSTERAGGIALDSSGNIFIASDTNSTNLPVTGNAHAQTYHSSTTDGFLAEFQMGSSPSLAYCSYLGLDGEIGIGGVAIDATENAYIAGFTSDPNADFPATNAVQSVYGGGDFDAFLMKISTNPTGSGSSSVAYATLLGGSGTDQALAVALDGQSPPSAYVTGTTSSPNFPTNGTVAAYQANLPSNANAQTSDAFLSVVAQSSSGTTVTTSLFYSTYLGGSQTDSGESVAISAPSGVYIGGTANSWDFPWRDNLQPFNGYGDAFVAKLDPTSSGTASLIYATPLGGTSPPGINAGAQGSGIVLDSSGSIWVAGATTSADFPTAGKAGNGFQQICASCQESPAAADAFMVAIQENDSQQVPSLYFSAPSVPVNFGKQSLGSTNIPPQFAAIKNGGEAPLIISTIGITGPNGGDFSLSNASSCMSATLQPGAICSFEVSFIPTVSGPEGAFVQVTSNAPGSPQVLEIFGEGRGFVVLPGSLNFGTQLANATSGPQTVTLSNTANDLAFIDSIQENGSNAEFPPASISDACAASATLSSGSSCQISFDFAPTAAGSFQAEVDIQYHVQGLPEQELTVPLSGVGLPAAPVASLQPPALNFGGVAVGASEQAQVVTLTNTGSAALNVTSIGIAGANATDFSIAAVGNSACPMSTGSLAIGASCTVGVQFAPKSAGSKSAALTFTDNAAGSPQSISLSGSAESTALQIAPTTLTFSSQSIGTKSAAQQITVSNSGSSALGVNGVSVAGTNAGDFGETNNCPPSLAANAACTVNVVFQPTATGARNASISISDNAPNSPQTVAVTGTGAEASVTLAPAGPISFGNQAAGTPSAAAAITVMNNGTGALSVSRISFSGANGADFSETDNCNASVPPAGTCTIKVVFQPACGNNQAARNASLVLTDNAPNSPQNVALSGTATGDICFTTASGGSVNATVAAGGSATYSLDVSAASGYTGNVTLGCSGAPQNSTCTVNPPSVSVAGSTLAPFTANVTTTAAVAEMIRRAPVDRAARGFSSRTLQISFYALAYLGILMMLFVAGPRTGVRWRWVRIAILLCVVGTAAAGCGSGGGDPAVVQNPGTPDGTYKLTITGTAADGTSQSILLTLTVD